MAGVRPIESEHHETTKAIVRISIGPWSNSVEPWSSSIRRWSNVGREISPRRWPVIGQQLDKRCCGADGSIAIGGDRCNVFHSLPAGGSVDGGNQRFPLKRLEQIGSRAHRLATFADAGFVVSGDDDARNLDPMARQMMEQIEAG